jgi:hypothetical protein
MLRLETKGDLDALHSGNVKESLHLEYKASPSIDKKDENRKLEMARDVSAFANGDGGQIVYGMAEKDHEPAGLDNGIDPKIYPEIWFEQVLQQHITPGIRGLKIRHVPLGDGCVAVVIDIPAATGDPHQVSDGRYYRRHNFNRLRMEHYEVRDAFRRATSPHLFVELTLSGNNSQLVEFSWGDELSKPISLGVSVSNRANQPEHYTIVKVGLDAALALRSDGHFEQRATEADARGRRHHWLSRSLSSPPDPPIFKESDPRFVGMPTFALRSSQLHSAIFYLTTVVQTPGFEDQQNWILMIREGVLTLLLIIPSPVHPRP